MGSVPARCWRSIAAWMAALRSGVLKTSQVDISSRATRANVTRDPLSRSRCTVAWARSCLRRSRRVWLRAAPWCDHPLACLPFLSMTVRGRYVRAARVLRSTALACPSIGLPPESWRLPLCGPRLDGRDLFVFDGWQQAGRTVSAP